jgi:hypothetical protein
LIGDNSTADNTFAFNEKVNVQSQINKKTYFSPTPQPQGLFGKLKSQLEAESFFKFSDANKQKFLHKKESEVHYTKYQSTNRTLEKQLRPFYKWKDGFFESYLKYCSPDAINRRAKRVKLPY